MAHTVLPRWHGQAQSGVLEQGESAEAVEPEGREGGDGRTGWHRPRLNENTTYLIPCRASPPPGVPLARLLSQDTNLWLCFQPVLITTSATTQVQGTLRFLPDYCHPVCCPRFRPPP